MPHHPEGHYMTKKLEKLPKKKIKKATKKLEKPSKRKIKKAAKQLGKMSKQILSEKLTKNPIDMKYGKGPHMGHSPAEMESAKQEKYNLMHDNPVAKHASGGSWMSKHSKSALHMGHSPAEMSPYKMNHDSPAKNLGHGMDKMSPEKGAHRDYHLKQRMSKKSKDSIAEMKTD